MMTMWDWNIVQQPHNEDNSNNYSGKPNKSTDNQPKRQNGTPTKSLNKMRNEEKAKGGSNNMDAERKRKKGKRK